MRTMDKSFDDTYARLKYHAIEITLEAFEKSSEARKLGQKLGDEIPGSIYLRCFCIRCGTPMRCSASRLFVNIMCRYCDPGHKGCSSPTERLTQKEKDIYFRNKNDTKQTTTTVNRGTKMMPLNFRDKMTEHQWIVYSALHPQGGDMSIQEAAKKLGISTIAVFLTTKRIKQKCPDAFLWEDEIKESIKCELNAHNIEYVYEGRKAKAKQNEIEFTLPFQDFINIVQLECLVCGRLPSEANREYPREAYHRKAGYRFSYNHLWRMDLEKDYTSENCTSICTGCANRKRSEVKRRKNK